MKVRKNIYTVKVYDPPSWGKEKEHPELAEYKEYRVIRRHMAREKPFGRWMINEYEEVFQ